MLTYGHQNLPLCSYGYLIFEDFVSKQGDMQTETWEAILKVQTGQTVIFEGTVFRLEISASKLHFRQEIDALWCPQRSSNNIKFKKNCVSRLQDGAYTLAGFLI